MCSQNDDPSQHVSDDTLRAALVRAYHDAICIPDGLTFGHAGGDTDAVCTIDAGRIADALAASATDEAEERRVVRDSEWTPLRKDVRPAVPALDVELGAPFWCYQHDRFCQYPIGPHRPVAALSEPSDD